MSTHRKQLSIEIEIFANRESRRYDCTSVLRCRCPLRQLVKADEASVQAVLRLCTDRKQSHDSRGLDASERENVLRPGHDQAPLLTPEAVAAGSQHSSSVAWSSPLGSNNHSAPLQHRLQEGAQLPPQQPSQQPPQERLLKVTDNSGRANDSGSKQWTSWDIAVEVKGYIAAVTLAFLLTLAVFPGIATSICSSHSVSATPPCTPHPHAGRLYGALTQLILEGCVSSFAVIHGCCHPCYCP